MNTIILSMIAVAIITAIIVNFIKQLDGYPGCKIFAILLFGIGIGGIIGNIIGLLGTPPTKIIETRKDIICLKDNSSIQGGFFLGCGTVNGSMAYTMYVKDKNRIYLKQIDCNDAFIQFIEDDKQPQLIDRTEKSINENWFLFGDRKLDYIILVPRNSIKQEIKLDAE